MLLYTFCIDYCIDYCFFYLLLLHLDKEPAKLYLLLYPHPMSMHFPDMFLDIKFINYSK